jgi:hypothetical protein
MRVVRAGALFYDPPSHIEREEMITLPHRPPRCLMLTPAVDRVHAPCHEATLLFRAARWCWRMLLRRRYDKMRSERR